MDMMEESKNDENNTEIERTNFPVVKRPKVTHYPNEEQPQNNFMNEDSLLKRCCLVLSSQLVNANNLLDFQKICQLPEELLHLVLSYLSAEDLWSLQSQFESESNNHENDSKLNAIFEEVWKDLCQVLKCDDIQRTFHNYKHRFWEMYIQHCINLLTFQTFNDQQIRLPKSIFCQRLMKPTENRSGDIEQHLGQMLMKYGQLVETLDLRNGIFSYEFVLQSLATFSNLKHIFFYNLRADQAPFATQLVEGILSIERLGFFFCKLGQTFSQTRTYQIPNVSCIQIGSCNPIPESACMTLIRWIQSTKRLQSLILRSNDLADSYFYQILQYTPLSYNGLEELSLKDNLLGPKSAVILNEFLTQNKFPQLVSLDLSNNSFDEEDVCLIAEGLCHHSTLTMLNLSDSFIQDGGASALAKCLSVSVLPLTKLILDSCQISSKGAHEIFSALLNNQILEHLSLKHNQLGVAFGRDLDSLLRNNKKLKSLCLSETGMKEVELFKEALHIHPTLQRFEFAANRIGDKGGILLLESIWGYAQLQEIDISETSKQLKWINLRRNKFSRIHSLFEIKQRLNIEHLYYDNDNQGYICDGIQEI